MRITYTLDDCIMVSEVDNACYDCKKGIIEFHIRGIEDQMLVVKPYSKANAEAIQSQLYRTGTASLLGIASTVGFSDCSSD